MVLPTNPVAPTTATVLPWADGDMGFGLVVDGVADPGGFAPGVERFASEAPRALRS